MYASKFSFLPKKKNRLVQLHRSFQRFPQTIQQVEMVLHHDKLMQQILSFCPIMKQEIEKEPGHSVTLKDIALLKCRRSDEVSTVSGIAAPGSGHGRHLSG
jgi:hypothetical protein